MNTNVRSPMLLMQALLPHLAPRGGRVINMSVLFAIQIMASYVILTRIQIIYFGTAASSR
jgi:NAD(P)-dependent dehydrogenase (short-subunit alcohol dehydrogenase family)